MNERGMNKTVKIGSDLFRIVKNVKIGSDLLKLLRLVELLTTTIRTIRNDKIISKIMNERERQDRQKVRKRLRSVQRSKQLTNDPLFSPPLTAAQPRCWGTDPESDAPSDSTHSSVHLFVSLARARLPDVRAGAPNSLSVSSSSSERGPRAGTAVAQSNTAARHLSFFLSLFRGPPGQGQLKTTLAFPVAPTLTPGTFESRTTQGASPAPAPRDHDPRHGPRHRGKWSRCGGAVSTHFTLAPSDHFHFLSQPHASINKLAYHSFLSGNRGSLLTSQSPFLLHHSSTPILTFSSPSIPFSFSLPLWRGLVDQQEAPGRSPPPPLIPTRHQRLFYLIEVAKKAALRSAARQKTDGGVENVVELTKVEERIISLMGRESFAVDDRHLALNPFSVTSEIWDEYTKSKQGMPAKISDENEECVQIVDSNNEQAETKNLQDQNTQYVLEVEPVDKKKKYKGEDLSDDSEESNYEQSFNKMVRELLANRLDIESNETFSKINKRRRTEDEKYEAVQCESDTTKNNEGIFHIYEDRKEELDRLFLRYFRGVVFKRQITHDIWETPIDGLGNRYRNNIIRLLLNSSHGMEVKHKKQEEENIVYREFS
ncbi:unnamed protein product [Diatraea saccharalis]|uniref:Uncharacterized protein n=1 Tax=Diatraea saccharalis TaxID=40085 RepID=A0A9N9R756_9NEOP|nr:unnamed protein product [Diatraea saccharalis]